MRRSIVSFRFLLLVFLALTRSCAAGEGSSEEAKNNASSESGGGSSSHRTNRNTQDFDASNEDWGSYYDPQNVFCGKFDCYKILGFDYESFGRNPPDTRDITKRYRALSREWHPDKSKHKDAKERFVKIARAYEVLTSKELRAEYDDMRYDMEKYFQKYGTSVLWSYAPKSDTALVILMILIIANIFSWYSQKHRWQLVADRLIKAAVEDWSPSQGGTAESKHLREDALAILAEREAQSGNGEVKDPSPKKNAGGKKKSQKAKKVSGKEKKRQEQEALRPIVTEMVNEMDDFGGGFHKPTWRDLFIVSLVSFPYKLTKETVWFAKYYMRRLQKKELNDEERRVLTQRAVGPVTWDTATEEEREALISKELWIVSNLAEWSEWQEFNKLSASEKKEFMRLKKMGIVPDKDD